MPVLGPRANCLIIIAQPGPKVKPGNHICGLSYKNPGGISCTVSLCRQEAFYAAILPYTRAAARWLLLAAVSAAAGFALGVAASRPAPLSQAAVIPTPPPAGQPAPGRGPGGSSLPGAAPPASQAELPPLVCLTFDDGPSRTTPAVLAALEEAEVPATFFVVANENNESYLPLIRQAAQAGCEIALHSASHRYSDIYRSADAFWEDIALLRQRIAPYVDDGEVRCLRFPGAAPTPSAANTAGTPSWAS